MANPNPYNQRGPDGRLIPRSEAVVSEASMTFDEQSLEQREIARARSRGVPDQEIERWRQNVLWGLSGRTDSRVVLYERDVRHPGGEAFIAGPTPDFVYRTGQVQQLVMQGLILEVPEPMRTVKLHQDGQEVEVANRRYPSESQAEAGLEFAAQPGRPIPLGRVLDPELFDAQAIDAVANRIKGRPTEVPATGAFVPTQQDVDRPS